MKEVFRKVFQPILTIFESGEGEYVYKDSHRKILFAVGGLFLVLSTASAYFTISAAQYGGLIPVAVFFGIGFVCEIVGLLGTDRAVAKMWGSK
jgi:hypothetical protein